MPFSESVHTELHISSVISQIRQITVKCQRYIYIYIYHVGAGDGIDFWHNIGASSCMALKFHVWDLRLRSQGLEVDLSAYAASLDLGGWDCCGVVKGFGRDCGRFVAGF